MRLACACSLPNGACSFTRLANHTCSSIVPCVLTTSHAHMQQQQGSGEQGASPEAASASGVPGDLPRNPMDSGATTESSIQAKPVVVKRSCTEAMLKVSVGPTHLISLLLSDHCFTLYVELTRQPV